MQHLTFSVRPKFREQYGVSVTGTPVELLVYARKGVINLSEPPLASRHVEAPAPRRRYRRKDLTAE
jgi:hypothetical protein